MKKRNVILSFILGLTGLFAVCNLGFVPEDSISSSDSELTASRSITTGVIEDSDPGVMLHAYMWSFSAIKAALPEISNAGYTSIQTSPVQKTKADGEWWMLYQPCSFDIGNTQLGSYDDFVSLCEEAENYGIKIIVDAVLNHVADNGSDGQWSDSIDSYLKRSDWYHNYGTCTDYASRWNVTQRNLGNLPDLNTQNYDVQNVMKTFLNQCVDAGADGFRFDAAKHIETNIGDDQNTSWFGNFWDNVLGALHNKDSLYLVGEVLPDNSDNDEAYTNYFDITAHSYLWTVDNAVNNKNLTGINTIWRKDHELSPTQAMVYVENHDTYEHGETSSLTYYTRKMANAILIARDGVAPRVFDRPGEELWKDADIAAMNHFHNAMTGTSEYLRNPESDVLVIDRGTIGTAIINVGDGTNIYVDTNLAAGTYSNHASSSATLTSNGSQLSGYVPGGSIVVLYDSSTTPVDPVDPVETVTTVRVHYDVGVGNNITLRGDTDPLSWSAGIATEWTSGNIWTVTLSDISEGAVVNCKPLINDSTWASGDNYSVTGGSSIDIYPPSVSI